MRFFNLYVSRSPPPKKVAPENIAFGFLETAVKIFEEELQKHDRMSTRVDYAQASESRTTAPKWKSNHCFYRLVSEPPSFCRGV